jgi:uncharacterized protein
MTRGNRKRYFQEAVMSRILARAMVLGLLCAQMQLRAAEDPNQRTITVSGEAEMKVVPDEVILTLGVETRHKDLAEVKRMNDQRMKEVLAAVLASGVASKDVRTDYLNLTPEYDYSSTTRRRTFLEYAQRTTVLVTLRDVSKFETLLTAVLRSGVEYIHGVDFRTSELRKYRDEARSLAMKAAKEKAVALAGALGQKVGKPKSIQEGQGGYGSSYGGWWGRGYQGASQNVSQFAGNSNASQEGPLAPGTLSIRASVSITFDLE